MEIEGVPLIYITLHYNIQNPSTSYITTYNGKLLQTLGQSLTPSKQTLTNHGNHIEIKHGEKQYDTK